MNYLSVSSKCDILKNRLWVSTLTQITDEHNTEQISPNVISNFTFAMMLINKNPTLSMTPYKMATRGIDFT